MSRDHLYLLNGRYRLASPMAGLSFPQVSPSGSAGRTTRPEPALPLTRSGSTWPA